MAQVTAIVLSGGSGSRFHGSFIPKQFAEIEGKPILAYCLDTYEALPAVDEVVLIINARYEQLYYDICSTYGYLKVRKLIHGGQTRQESVARGLEAIDPCEGQPSARRRSRPPTGRRRTPPPRSSPRSTRLADLLPPSRRRIGPPRSPH